MMVLAVRSLPTAVRAMVRMADSSEAMLPRVGVGREEEGRVVRW